MADMSMETGARPEFGGRKDYNQTAQERLVGCFTVTDIIDDLLQSSLPTDDGTEAKFISGPDGTRITRSFRFLEGELGPDLVSSIIEKWVDIEYLRTPSGKLPPHETYTIYVRDMELYDKPRTLMRNRYTIEYFGTNRTSGIATIEQPNFVDRLAGKLAVRETTPYDQRMLNDEISRLCRAVDAGELEERAIASFDTEEQ